ncbi:MAG: hypothetical protein JKY48_13150 [Flavobacteriales bacterium]|nr:hypothetical protein [Flavobacteriales bacterium]
MEWLASNESSLSAIAAIIAIIAGLAVVFRLIWVRMVAGTRPAFLSDWRNIGLIILGLVALLSVLLLATNEPETNQIPEAAQITKFTGKPSVAVLPLNYISDNDSHAFLADGIAEDVITILSRNPRLLVIARNSSFAYKGQSPDIRTVGEELGVRYVVEGSVQKIGERLRITAQLIDSTNGQHLWAEKYDRPLADIFALQDDIANAIAASLGDSIFHDEIARTNRASTDNLDAWGLVMRASRSYAGFDRNSVNQAIALLREAVALDPDYALAKAELSRSLCYRVVNYFSENLAADIAESYAMGEQALEQAPEDALVLYTAGYCYGYMGLGDESKARRRDSIRLLEKALSKQPDFASGLSSMGILYIHNGQAELGLEKLEKAIKLAPRAPDIYLTETYRAFALNELGRYSEAEQAAQTALRAHDSWMATWVMLACARAGQRDIAGAQRALYEAKKREPWFSLEMYKHFSKTLYKNKGVNVLAILEPIWPEDLLTADE